MLAGTCIIAANQAGDGNYSAAVQTTQSITLDTIKPTLTVATPPDGLSTNVSPLNVSGTVSDASGIKSVTVNGTAAIVQPNDTFSYALPLAPEGNKVVTVIATDNADNTTTIIRTINYDITPISFTVSEPPDNSQTNSTPLTVAGTVGETGGIIEIKNTTSGTTATDVTVNGTKFSGYHPA